MCMFIEQHQCKGTHLKAPTLRSPALHSGDLFHEQRKPTPHCFAAQALREEAAETRSRLQLEMDGALEAQQQRAAAWQAKLAAEEARLSELASALQV